MDIPYISFFIGMEQPRTTTALRIKKTTTSKGKGKGLGYKSGRKECKKRHSKSPNPHINIKIR
jgi:hypothetical protein